MHTRNQEPAMMRGRHGRTRLGMSLLAAVALASISGCVAPDRTAWEDGRLREIVDATQFERHAISAPRPVLAVFHSPGCPHCASLFRKLPGLAEEFRGQIAFVTVDVTRVRDLQAHYGVRKVPTLLFLRHGQIVERHEGSRPRFMLRHDIGNLLK